MTVYVLVANGTVVRYPYTDLRTDNPNTSFPEAMPDVDLEPWGVFAVVPSTPPQINPLTQTIVEDTPVLAEGVWTQVWVVRAATQVEATTRVAAIQASIIAQTQYRLDAFALTRGYDNIVSACSYATSTHAKYGPEGRYCVDAREQTWDTLFAGLAEVAAGTRPMPTGYSDIEAELPALVWPV